VWSAALFFSGDPAEQVMGVALGFGSAPALTGGYVALFALATRRRGARLAEPAGRMSLTVYLGESIILSAVFCGWGLGLLGTLPAAPAAAVAVSVWLALEIFAKLWLATFRYGPFEWLLRCWSTATWVPLRTPPPSHLPGEDAPTPRSIRP
jgi:uncharacterized protein